MEDKVIKLINTKKQTSKKNCYLLCWSNDSIHYKNIKKKKY